MEAPKVIYLQQNRRSGVIAGVYEEPIWEDTHINIKYIRADLVELTADDIRNVSRILHRLDDEDKSDVRIESCPKESDNCENLDEEVIKYWNDHALEYRLGRVADIDFLHLTARHFAEWQKKQDQETIELAEDHAMLAGRMQAKEEFDQKCQGCFDRDEVFHKGIQHAKEEMMKEAITADIDDFGVKMYEYFVEKLGLTSENKVKLYVFKDND